MNTMSKRPCPVCGHGEADELHRLNLVLFDNHPLSNVCVTAVCSQCGMAFNCATPPSEAYNRYYSELSKYVVSTSAKAPMPRLPECAEMLSRLLSRETSILDAGCGSGGLLAALKNAGFTNLAGIDPTPECVRVIRDELGIDARVGSLDAPGFAPSTFDVVISTVVFEHLCDPGGDVDRIGAMLKPEGMAYILVPDASRYGEFMESPFQDINVEHINHFSIDALNKLFARRGWETVKTGRDVFRFSPTWQNTLIWGMYRNVGKVRQPQGGDPSLRRGLVEYCARSTDMLAVISARLQDDLRGEPEIIIWGAGHLTSVLLAHGGLAGKRIRAVVDSNPNYKGRRLSGVPVGGYDLRGDFSGPVVVATIREQESVLKQIKKLGWPNRVVCLRNR